MDKQQYDVLIVGGSHAGCEAAFRLRQGGFSGSIGLLSAESCLPYHRPPLSKAFLAGEANVSSLVLRSEEAFAKAKIDWLPDTLVASIDRVDHFLNLANGGQLSYGKLILATGGRPRALALPGCELAGIHMLRSLADAQHLQPEFLSGKRLVIIGAGYIGLEVAAVAIKHGLTVEIVEFAPRVLARVAGAELSSFYEAMHKKAGVIFHLNTGVEGFVAAPHDASQVGLVRCTGGKELPADLVLVAAGLVPNSELAKEAGLKTGNGILVDKSCCTSDPDIFAIGDVAAFPLPFLNGQQIRLESVPNAMEHARIVASVLNNCPSPYNVVPWFWSDQYQHKLQSVGLNQGYDTEIVRLPKNPESFVVFYMKEGRMIAADCVSAIADFNIAKKLVAGKVIVDAKILADSDSDLKSLVS